MKFLALVLVFFSVTVDAYPRCQPDLGKPHHCHKPVPKAAPGPEPTHPAGGYAIMGAISSLAVSDYLKSEGHTLKAQLGWSVIAPVLVAGIMEKESEHRDDAVVSAVLGGLTAQFLRHEF